jgi:hypothetical protein
VLLHWSAGLSPASRPISAKCDLRFFTGCDFNRQCVYDRHHYYGKLEKNVES